jgi:hypothetical protein
MLNLQQTLIGNLVSVQDSARQTKGKFDKKVHT